MNKQYTKEFIEETIALIRAQSYSVSEAATIGDWLSIIQWRPDTGQIRIKELDITHISVSEA